MRSVNQQRLQNLADNVFTETIRCKITAACVAPLRLAVGANSYGAIEAFRRLHREHTGSNLYWAIVAAISGPEQLEGFPHEVA